MKKRFSTFGLLNFFIVLVLLFRQIYYMNLISSFVISNEIESGILLLLSIIVLIGLTAFFVYYLPALLVIKVTLNLEFKIVLPNVEREYGITSYDFVQVQNRIFKKLQVIRC